MDTSPPEPVKQWMRSVDEPWKACERADWFIYVAREHGYSVRQVVQALARTMAAIPGPAELRDVIEALRELTEVCASGRRPSPALEEQLRVNVRPRLIDWNVALQYQHAEEVPDGIPRRATLAEEPVRQWANAALRLRTALELDGASMEPWAVLTLVAQYVVFVRADTSAVRSTRELDEAHRHVSDALRAELLSIGGV